MVRKQVAGKELVFTFSVEFSFKFDLCVSLPLFQLDHYHFCFTLPFLEIFQFQVR